jgi:hypothetical protein
MPVSVRRDATSVMLADNAGPYVASHRLFPSMFLKEAVVATLDHSIGISNQWRSYFRTASDRSEYRHYTLQ